CFSPRECQDLRGTTIDKSHISAWSVRSVSIRSDSLLSVSTHTLVVQNVERAFVGNQSLKFIRESIQDKNHISDTSVWSVERSLLVAQTLMLIKEFIQGRNHLNVWIVGKCSVGNHT
uniref:Uncharacterized protein n=1 Tax=Salvator merianae TaxID=96440 RepID=A0A8D0KME9_SALMN